MHLSRDVSESIGEGGTDSSCSGFCGFCCHPHGRGCLRLKERDVYGWDSPAPTPKSQVSCSVDLKENREKESKTQLNKKASTQISGKGKEKGVSCAGQPIGVCTDNGSSEHGSAYTHPACCA